MTGLAYTVKIKQDLGYCKLSKAQTVEATAKRGCSRVDTSANAWSMFVLSIRFPLQRERRRGRKKGWTCVVPAEILELCLLLFLPENLGPF